MSRGGKRIVFFESHMREFNDHIGKFEGTPKKKDRKSKKRRRRGRRR